MVSIITAAYNVAPYIEQTILSVKGQTYLNWEWIIVDDGSTDGTDAIISAHKKKDHRIKFYRLKENKGPVYARNKAISLSNGRYLAFLDSDDLWLPHHLSRSLQTIEKQKCELVFASYKRVDVNLKPLLKDFIVPKKVEYKDLLYSNPIPMITSVLDTKRTGKIYQPKVDSREDYGFWLSVLKQVPFAHGISEPTGIYRIRAKSASRNKYRLIAKQYAVYRDFLNLSILKSIYYTFFWGINGVCKYFFFQRKKGT